MRLLFFFLAILFRSTALTQITVATEDPKIIAKTSLSTFYKHSFSLKGTCNPFIRIFDSQTDNSLYKHNIDFGINLDYVHARSSKKAIGFEYNIRFSKLNDAYQKPFIYNSLLSLDNLNIDHEAMKIIVQQIIPKAEWKFSKQYSSYEYVHQIGIGLSIINVLKSDYNYRLNFEEQNSQYYEGTYGSLDLNDAENNFKKDEFYDYKNKPFYNGTIMYSFQYRRRLTPSLFWSVGVKTELQFSKYSFNKFDHQYEMEDMNSWVTRREMEFEIWENRFKSLFSMQLGLVYKFSVNK